MKFIRNLMYFLAFVLSFPLLVLPTIFAFYTSFKIAGVVIAFVLLPISSLAYPIISITAGKINGLQCFLDYLMVIIIFVLLILGSWFSNKAKSPRLRIPGKTFLITAKETIKWLILYWVEMLGLFIMLPFSILFVLMGDLRGLFFTISLRSRMWENDFPYLCKWVLLFFYLQLSVGIPGVIYQYFGTQYLFEAIVGTGGIIAFIALQLPKMLPPYYEVTFLNSEDLTVKKHPYRIESATGRNLLLIFRVTNLGLSAFKDSVFTIHFEKEIEIISDPQLYSSLDNKKDFIVHKESNTIEFLPTNNYLTLAPLNHLIFPVWISTPLVVDNFNIDTSLSTESAWSEAKRRLILKVN